MKKIITFDYKRFVVCFFRNRFLFEWWKYYFFWTVQWFCLLDCACANFSRKMSFLQQLNRAIQGKRNNEFPISFALLLGINVMEPLLKYGCRWNSAISIFNSTFQYNFFFSSWFYIFSRTIFDFTTHKHTLYSKPTTIFRMNSLLFCDLYDIYDNLPNNVTQNRFFFASHHIENNSNERKISCILSWSS